jgi:hypothetical protein
VKHVPIIIMYILQMTYDETHPVATRAIVNMIFITFFFLLRPGEYTGTTYDETTFWLEDVDDYIRERELDFFQCSDADLDATTSVPYTFTTQNNGTHDEKLVQGRGENSLCCPIRDTVRRVEHHQLKKSTPHAPISSYFLTNRCNTSSHNM